MPKVLFTMEVSICSSWENSFAQLGASLIFINLFKFYLFNNTRFNIFHKMDFDAGSLL